MKSLLLLHRGKFCFLKVWMIFAGLFASFQSHAVTLEIWAPCESKLLLKNQSLFGGEKLGTHTLHALQRKGIEYIGSESGFNSIANTPIGDGAIEVVDNETLRAYGWCFSVNGVIPDVMADKVQLKTNDHVQWFFAYSTNYRNQWVNYCQPANEADYSQVCEDYLNY